MSGVKPRRLPRGKPGNAAARGGDGSSPPDFPGDLLRACRRAHLGEEALGEAHFVLVPRLVAREPSEPCALDPNEGGPAAGARLLDEGERALERARDARSARGPFGGEEDSGMYESREAFRREHTMPAGLAHGVRRELPGTSSVSLGEMRFRQVRKRLQRCFLTGSHLAC